MNGLGDRYLGSSQLKVSPIGLGCWQFAGMRMAAYWNFPPQEDIDRIVRVSLAGGTNWFDTAELYGSGRSELALSHGLREAGKNNGDVIIATKWNPILKTASTIAKTFPAREKHLSPFGVDLFQVHLPFSLSSIEAQMNAMADLLDARKIKAVGVSNFSARSMRRAQKYLVARGYSLASNQVRYNLLDRGIEKNGVLTAAKELNISIIAYSPLAQGLLGGQYHDDAKAFSKLPLMRRLAYKGRVEESRCLVKVLESIGREYDVSASQVALNWLVTYHGDTVVAIPGATKQQHAAENCLSMTFRLTRGQRLKIDESSRQFI
jgi:aryl-alcohol dehydrogenase-like predicted oxidoreductase